MLKKNVEFCVFTRGHVFTENVKTPYFIGFLLHRKQTQTSSTLLASTIRNPIGSRLCGIVNFSMLKKC